MNCALYHDWLQSRLDGNPVADRAAVLPHLAACNECRGLDEAVGRLERGLASKTVPPVPAGLHDRIVTGVLADLRARKRFRRVRLVAALAAALLIVLLGGAYLRQVWHSPDSLVPPDSSIAEATPDPVPSPRDSVAEAGSAVASLSRLARDETVEQTRMLLPVATAPLQLDGATLPAPLDPSAQSLREAGRGVSEGLQPVTTSARRAWDLFLREVPPAGGSSF